MIALSFFFLMVSISNIALCHYMIKWEEWDRSYRFWLWVNVFNAVIWSFNLIKYLTLV